MTNFLLLLIFGTIEALIIGFLIPIMHNQKLEFKKYFLFCSSLTFLIVTTKQFPINVLISMLLNMCVFIFLCNYIYKINFKKSTLTVLTLMILLLVSEFLSEVLFNKLPLECILDICTIPQNKLIYSYISAHLIYAFFAVVVYILARIFWSIKSKLIFKG